MRRLLRRFGDSRRGAVAVIMASALPMIVGFAAVSVDLGSVYLTTRRVQGVADLAAMAAARDIDHAQAAALATLAANGVDAAGLSLTVGQYTADPALSPSARFTVGGSAPSAVQLTLAAPAPLFFGRLLTGKSSLAVSRTAMAASAQFASFEVGSGLASLQGASPTPSSAP